MEYKDGRKYCAGRRYFFGYYDGSRCCNYIFVCEKKRPCPPGKDCTERREKTKKQETEFNIIALSLYSIY